MSVLVQKTCSAPALLKLLSKGISSSSAPADGHSQWAIVPTALQENGRIPVFPFQFFMVLCFIATVYIALILLLLILSSSILIHCCSVAKKQYLKPAWYLFTKCESKNQLF